MYININCDFLANTRFYVNLDVSQMWILKELCSSGLRLEIFGIIYIESILVMLKIWTFDLIK